MTFENLFDFDGKPCSLRCPIETAACAQAELLWLQQKSSVIEQ
jgi:hypothetical protein